MKLRIPLLALLLAGCVSASPNDCRTPDEHWPFAPPPDFTFTDNKLDTVSDDNVFCVRAEDQSTGDLIPELAEEMRRLGFNVVNWAKCSGKGSPVRIDFETMVSACIDCGDCYDGPRFGLASIRLGDAQAPSARWTDMAGGTRAEIARTFARDLAKHFKKRPPNSG